MPAYDPPGKIILTHSPMGLRSELAISSEGSLEIWISPLPDQSICYRDRNFSNRDDHTRLFDRITLPGLTEAGFVRCDYDPFHVVIHLKKQIVHMVPLFDQPVIAIWFESPQVVDLKTDKADSEVQRTKTIFAVEHPDRQHKLHFVSVIGSGTGSFIHQPVIEDGRSIHARAELSPGQLLVFAGSTEAAQAGRAAAVVARSGTRRLLAANEKKVRAALKPGSFRIRNNARLQHLLDVNRRVLVAMQDPMGAIRAAMNRIYYMIWVRDGSIIEAFQAYAGAVEPLRRWVAFLLANPTDIPHPKFPGRSYTMLVNRLTKLEEDGVFYAIWSAFTLWTQTGVPLSKSEFHTLENAMEWLERYCFDSKQGLFGRYFACESPFQNSWDIGFDNATGKPMDRSGGSSHAGRPVVRSYDIYINQFAHDSYLMLAAMKPGGGGRYISKAENLAEKMRLLFAGGDLPDYGAVQTDDGKTGIAGPFGLDRTDYEWALAVSPFFSEPERLPSIRRALFDRTRKIPAGSFLAGYFSQLQSLDIIDIPETEILEAIEYAARQCYRPGTVLPMPNTVIEMLDMPDGHPWHDVRPQAFSIGPWLATMTGLGLRRLPFGLAVRPTRVLEALQDYQYGSGVLNVDFSGNGRHLDLRVNGKTVTGSWQIPEVLLCKGKNRVQVRLTQRGPAPVPILLGSTVRLQSVEHGHQDARYIIDAYGFNSLRFRASASCRFTVNDSKGTSISLTQTEAAGSLWIRFAGHGRFQVAAQYECEKTS